jgi:glycosyltransferase involved in cell wall biosynthesis
MLTFLLEPFRALYRISTIWLILRLLRNAQKKGVVRLADLSVGSTPSDHLPTSSPCKPSSDAVNSLFSERLLYVAASCLPYHISGYTTRTQAILKALKEGMRARAGGDHPSGEVRKGELLVLTRPGYPWDRSDRLILDLKIDSSPESGSGKAVYCTEVGGVDYHHLQHPSHHRPVALYVWQASRAIIRFAKLHQVSCIQAASNHVNALPALVAAKELGIPFYYEMRGLWELTRTSRIPHFENSQGYQQGLELEGIVARHADRVYVISEQLGRFTQGRWGIEVGKIALLPNCVSPHDFPRIASSSMKPYSIGSRSIGYAGSLMDYEGLDVLLKAISILTKDHTGIRDNINNNVNFQVNIVGDGESMGALKALTGALGIEKYVCFHGRVSPDQARALIADCGIVCLPRKPFRVCEIVTPIKLVEALAMGKPVIVPNLPVFRDELNAHALSEDAVPGWFFEAGNASDLARAIALAFQDQAILSFKSQNARSYALGQRNWQRYLSQAHSPFVMGNA